MGPFLYERPIDLSRAVAYKWLRPWWWDLVTAPRLRSLTDAEFLQRCGHAGDGASFVSAFHDRVRYRFFFHPRNRKDFFLNTLASTQPYDSIIEDAESAARNDFEALGSGRISLGERIDWHKDFVSGRMWPLDRRSALRLVHPDGGYDVKVPWELSRFHQVWWLGKGHWLTGNAGYAKHFGDLVEDWMRANPVGLGVNWANPMEASVRACNWIAGYYLFCTSPGLTADFWIRFLRGLYSHGCFIEQNLEYAARNHNHLLSNFTALTMLGVFFSDTTFGHRWLERGRAGLEEEMQNQVCEDGVSYEKAVSYHRLATELLTVPAVLCQINGRPLSNAYLKRLELMFEFMSAYTRPDGSAPTVGDADDGRLYRYRINEDMNDHRPLMAVGALLFKRSDLKPPSGNFSQDALWLLGGEGFELHQRLGGSTHEARTRAFPNGGFYVLQSPRAHVFIDAGDLGQRGRGGHGHNDVLSFELWADGGPVIVDPGTYSYTSDPSARHEFRRTRAHNTIEVDGREQADLRDLWSVVEDRTDPRTLEWSPGAHRDVLVAEHRGYGRLLSPVTHRRRFDFDRLEGALSILDTAEGTGIHTILSSFHLHPSVQAVQDGEREVLLLRGPHAWRLTMSEGSLALEPGWYSPSYGVRQYTIVVRCRVERACPMVIGTVIRPVPSATTPVEHKKSDL